MPTVTASTPMPTMPLLPEFDALADDETGLSTRFYAAMFAAAHRFVTGVRAKRDFASAYVSGRTESALERARCVRARRAARKALDQLGLSLPQSVHKALVSFAILGGRCGRLAA